MRSSASLLWRSARRWGSRRAGRATRIAPRGGIPGDEAAREAYLAALHDVGDDGVDVEIAVDIERLGLGKRRRALTVRVQGVNRSHSCHAKLIALVHAPDDRLPIHPVTVPEVAIAGRSNVGKSSLLNALVGQAGLASVDTRPGWTTCMQFFELRDDKTTGDGWVGAHEVIADPSLQPPIMTLVDLPGYGPTTAAVSASRRVRWGRLLRQYLRSRPQLASVFVLIDSSLGVTSDDDAFLDMLDGIPRLRYHAVMTKADLLTPTELAQSHGFVWRKMAARPGFAGGDIPMCSTKNAAGVAELWERLRLGAQHRLWDEGEGEGEGEGEMGSEADDEADGAAAETATARGTRMRTRTRRTRTHPHRRMSSARQPEGSANGVRVE